MGKALLAAVLCVLVGRNATAELTATVSPGYRFSQNERPTVSTLNQLGTPTILIQGTVDGSTGLSAGSVNGSHLASTVVDGSNTVFNAASPPAISIKNSGVGTAQISTAIAGNGLAGGGGTALSVTVDGSTLVITNDTVSVGTNQPHQVAVTSGKLLGGHVDGQGTNVTVGTGLFLGGGVLTVSNFTTFEYSLGSGTIVNTNHNMGATPSVVLWRLICKTADLGYEVGDEVDVSAFYNAASFKPQFSPGANSTNLFLVEFSTTINVRRKDTGADDTITASRWRAIGRARQ